MNPLDEAFSLDDDHRLAARIATAAGEALNAIRASAVLAGKPLGAVGDAAANELIVRMLAQVRPDDGFLSEESAPDARRLKCDRVWIIDPLDGTREYGESIEGRDDWAVHVALTVGGKPDACAVALPALGRTFATGTPAKLLAAPQGQLKILVSRTRVPELAQKVAERLSAELVPMGSAGAKAMAVVRGEAHAYLHAGGQYEWDSCAPVGVALAAAFTRAALMEAHAFITARMPECLICSFVVARSPDRCWPPLRPRSELFLLKDLTCLH